MADDIKAALDYLKQQGHDIGQVFMPPKTTKLHIWIDDRACSYEQSRNWAALERKKKSVSGLDSPALVDLAVACLQVAESGKVDSATASQARALDDEWKTLVQSATSPTRSLAEARVINSQAKELADRMLKFLITQLALISS